MPSGTVERHTAAVTIAADGAHSRIARAAGLVQTPPTPRRWAIGATFRGVDGLTGFGEMHVREHCYIGVAPLPDAEVNACVVTADRNALRQRHLLLSTLREDRDVGPRFAGATMVTAPSILGPLALDATAAGTPGLLLAGDAAGFIDPMTGDGLRFAFRGAELAAAEALQVLENGWGDAHRRLADARQREFGAKWRFNRYSSSRCVVTAERACGGTRSRGNTVAAALRNPLCWRHSCRLMQVLIPRRFSDE